MKIANKNKFVHGKIADFDDTGGYFIGQFMGQRGKPVLETEEVEVAWKKIQTEFSDSKPHYHKRGVEINIVINGSITVLISEKEITIRKGEFLIVYPETELLDISAEEETEMIVVKSPSVPDDKFYR